MTKYYATTKEDISAKERMHSATVRRLARECPVLLENDGALPFDEKKVALYGRGARWTVKGGTGSGDVNSRFTVNVEEGLRDSLYEITTVNWLNRNDEVYSKARDEYRDWVTKEAEKQGTVPFLISFSHPFREPADVAILPSDLKEDTKVAIYVIARNSGEGCDRKNEAGDYLFYEEELRNIKLIADYYEKTIVVLNIGGVMDLSPLQDISGINALILMGQLGNTGGYVLADILGGKCTPSGKLTDTWAWDYSDYPSSKGFSLNDGDVDDEYYSEGIYVGYRYFDTFGKRPLYPFGYGLSYTQFSIETKEIAQKGDKIELVVDVTNIGNQTFGLETVQVYYSAPQGQLHKPYQELAAYGKTNMLAGGEKQTLHLSFAISDMASYCEKCASWVLEEGTYLIRVGNCSNKTKLVAAFTLNETIKCKTLKNILPRDEKWEELTSDDTNMASRKESEAAHAPISIPLDPSLIPVESVSYSTYPRTELTSSHSEVLTIEDVRSGKCSVEDLVAQLSVEELANYMVGSMRSGLSAIVGEASECVPGAAGDTSSLLKKERGIKNMVLADGPAGLRLKPHFRTDLEGNMLPGGDVMGDSFDPFPEMEEGTYIDYYQYCTAIPIGWSLAMSWNTGLVEECGRIIGEEMETFGVDLWLAPALNIHRNPLCGRNFEYYSEDPYVAGSVAAAMTKGVQSYMGKGTTIKHFAANSQEENRQFTNSHISERALREIYLKNFEICVKNSKPLSVMSSYNLINGVHAACSYDLLQSVLRDEWGFEGFVMTDWFASQDIPMLSGDCEKKYPISSPAGCGYAGNDVQMPGGQSIVDDLIKSVTEQVEVLGYQLSKADMQFCVCNILRIAALMRE